MAVPLQYIKLKKHDLQPKAMAETKEDREHLAPLGDGGVSVGDNSSDSENEPDVVYVKRKQRKYLNRRGYDGQLTGRTGLRSSRSRFRLIFIIFFLITIWLSALSWISGGLKSELERLLNLTRGITADHREMFDSIKRCNTSTEKLSTNQTDLDGRMMEVLKGLTQVTSRVQEMRAKESQLEKRIGLSPELEALPGAIRTLAGSVASIGSRMSDFNLTAERVFKELSALREQVNNLTNIPQLDPVNLTGRLGQIKEKLSDLNETLGEHVRLMSEDESRLRDTLAVLQTGLDRYLEVSPQTPGPDETAPRSTFRPSPPPPTSQQTSTSNGKEPERWGDLKFGDKCTETGECGFKGSICGSSGSCVCRPELPVTDHFDKCGIEVEINGTCFFHAQCETRTPATECRDHRCMCIFEMKAIINKHNQVECIADYVVPKQERYVDPTMIGVLVGMALMFVTICVVLRLFSKARWSENRSIFNTPNPRLMNVSLLRDTKAGAGERRGSRGSANKPPSRQPSLASLRPTSPLSHGSNRVSPRVSPRSSPRASRKSSPVEVRPSSMYD